MASPTWRSVGRSLSRAPPSCWPRPVDVPRLDAWHRPLASALEPAPGSALSTHDAEWPKYPATEVVKVGLGSARDHLQAIRVHIDASEGFPFAQSTLVRAALVGATQTIWVLGPEDYGTRQERIWRFLLMEYTERARYVRLVLREVPPERLEVSAEDVLALLDDRSAEVRNRLDAAGLPGARDRLDVTAIVRYAAKRVFDDGTRDRTAVTALVAEVEATWRSTSAAAHGLALSALGSADTTAGTADDAGMASHQVTGGITRLANDCMCAYHLATHGWRLFADRAGLPFPSVMLGSN